MVKSLISPGEFMRKTILVAALVIIVLSLIISLAPKYKAVEINAKESIVESDEDIYVTDATYPIHGDVTFRQKGNVTVSNGVLDIRNGATLQFIQANYEKDRHFMTLNNNSKLIMENNAMLTVTPKQLDPWLKFGLTINNSELYIKDSKIAFPGWITITNSNVTIINSTITKVEEIPTVLERDDNDDCPLLYFENSNVTIINSRIEHYYECTLPEQVFVSSPSNFTFLPGVNKTFQFIPSDIEIKTDRLSAVILEITYEANESYDGKNFVQYLSKDGLYYNTSIQPQNKTDTKIFDLFSEGINNIKDLEKLCVRFENDGNVNVTFDSVRVVFSYENDITLVNSKLYAIDTYMDIDFRRGDVDPRDDVTVPTSPSTYFIDADMQHNALRVCENSEAHLYNVTVDSSETGGIPEIGNPPFISDDSSTIILYRWLDIRTTDFPGTSLDGVRVEVNLTETPSNIVLDYLGKPINKTENGKVIIPVPTDVMLPKNWPNSKFIGNYKIECYYSNYSVSSSMSFVQFPCIDEEYNTELVTVVFTKLIPEFTVNMDVSNSVMQNEVVQVNATIYNTGTTNAYNVPVIFYDNGEEFGKRNAGVVMGDSTFVSVNWTAVSTTPSEVHNISVVVNPSDAIDVIPEINYENNEAYKLVTVYSRPDLSVESISFLRPFAVEGDEITISASIFNSGETDANAEIEFYKAGMLFNSSDVSVAAEDSSFVNISFNTAGEGGNVLITVKITNSTPEESNVLNNEKSETIFVYAEHSMVIDSDKVLPPSFTWKGYIIVKDNGSLTLSNATLTMKENTEKQCEIIVLNNGELIVQNSAITSNANLKLYLYDNSVLTVINSTMMLDLVGSGESEISIQNSVINGTVNVSCEMFSAAEFNLNGDLKLNTIIANIENSFINATNINISALYLWANNTNLTSPLTFSMGNAYLTNVTVMQITSIDATIYRSWWVTVEVTDLAGSALHNATVTVYSTQTEPFKLVASSLTDENGTAVIALLTDTNYLINAAYENRTHCIYKYIENNTRITAMLHEVIVKPSSLVITITPIPEVKAGEVFIVTGTINYNIKTISIENVTATITVNVKPYSVDVNPDGTYSKEITAPNKGGTYPVKITVVDYAYNLSAEETAQLIVKGKPAPPPDYTPLIVGTVIAVVIIIIIGVIFFKKREKIKPYLLILKAKIKKEEFIECGECGKKIPGTFKKCPYCGAEFEEELVKCSECSAFIPASANKCPKCGAMFEE